MTEIEKRTLTISFILLGVSLLESCFIFEGQCGDDGFDVHYRYRSISLKCISCSEAMFDTIRLVVKPDVEVISQAKEVSLGSSAYALSCLETYIPESSIQQLEVYAIYHEDSMRSINNEVVVRYWSKDYDRIEGLVSDVGVPQFNPYDLMFEMDWVNYDSAFIEGEQISIQLTLEDGTQITEVMEIKSS